MKLLALLLIVFAGLCARAADEFVVPSLEAPVNDNAGIIDDQTSYAIGTGLRRLKDATGTQITVLTIPSLGGLTIEQASIQVTDKWKLGSRGTDNGVLLIVAPTERKVRIEVGTGLEGVLTDAYSNRIIQDQILPRFRQGDFSQGILAGVVGIIHYTNPDQDPQTLFGGSQQREQPMETGRHGLGLGAIFWIIVILVLLFGGRGGGRGLMAGFLLGNASRGWGGGGGWSGGSGGGGGWSGGGGGFSGGGASGGW